jgi:hypothetical protein
MLIWSAVLEIAVIPSKPGSVAAGLVSTGHNGGNDIDLKASRPLLTGELLA